MRELVIGFTVNMSFSMLALGRRRLCLSRSVQAEVQSIARMGSASLRETVDALNSKRDEFSPSECVAVMKAVCGRISDIQTDMRYWDLVSVVSAYGSLVSKNMVEQSDLEPVARLLTGRVSQLSVKHLLDLLLAFESMEFRPKDLFASVCNRLVDIAGSSMYADELVALTRTLARIDSPTSVSLAKSINRKILTNESLFNQLRFLHCCEVAGGLGKVGHLETKLEKKLEEKCMHELTVMPIEEQWKTVTGFPTLVFSYAKFEDAAKQRLRTTVHELESHQFDQVTRPMDFLQFIRMQDWLTDEVLIAACKWANDAVYRPATRTQAFRRPTIFEVTLLADLCERRSIPHETIEKAIKITVTSKGGTQMTVAKPKPLRYRRRRAYIREADGYASLGVEPVKAVAKTPLTEEKKDNMAAFAPKLRAGGVALWKARSGPWFFRK